MRTRFRWDRDLECLVEVGRSNYFEECGTAPAVISDDVGAGVNGLRHMPSGKMIDSKSGHRRETKARGLVEVGNDRMASQKPRPHPDDYMREVIDARQQLESNWNGTADWAFQQRMRKD